MNTSLRQARVDLEYGCGLYEEGRFEEAFLAFQRAAKRGNAEAQTNLGNLYDAGEGVARDRKRAAYWYKRAIKKTCRKPLIILPFPTSNKAGSSGLAFGLNAPR